MTLAETIIRTRWVWMKKHGRCTMCSIGDKPINGMHKESYACGNAISCTNCQELKPGQQCKTCFRISQEE